MKRVASLYLPDWPIERIVQAERARRTTAPPDHVAGGPRNAGRYKRCGTGGGLSGTARRRLAPRRALGADRAGASAHAAGVHQRQQLGHNHGAGIAASRAHIRPRDARFRGIDADWLGLMPLRLGMRIVQGLSEIDAAKLMAARGPGAFTSVEDVWLRSGAAPATLEKLAQADAFRDFGLDRRQALWAIKGPGHAPLPLFAAADASAAAIVPQMSEPAALLLPLTAGREVVEDYRATQMSLRAHPLSFLRGELDRRRITRCGGLKGLKDGTRIEVTGLILVRQRSGSAKGVVFVTLEDETGIANAILWPDRFEAQRRTVMSAAMLGISGRVQCESGVIHVIADRITDLTPLLRQVGDIDLPRLTKPGDGATQGGRSIRTTASPTGNHPGNARWKAGRHVRAGTMTT